MRKIFLLLFQYGWQMFLAAMIHFAFSGLFFFSLEYLNIFRATEEQRNFMVIFLATFFDSVTIVGAVNLFIRYFKEYENKFKNHVVLSFILFVLLLFVCGIEVSDFPGYDWRSLIITHYIPLMLILIPTAVGNILYAFLRREQKQIRKITEQEYQLLLLNELKTKAELEALQAKINPHFLYNALNSIAGLIHSNPDKAEIMVLLLSKFFRYSTHVKNEYLNSVERELEMVETYLEVEKVRFGERLRYEIELEDRRILQLLIPTFLLQPLVENAIKHGVSKQAEQGWIKIEMKMKEPFLQITVEDNGLPFPEDFQAGYGLQSTQEKLRLLGGEGAGLQISKLPKKQVVLTLRPVTSEKEKQTKLNKPDEQPLPHPLGG